MDDIFTRENDDSYREISLRNNNRALSPVLSKKDNKLDIIDDQIDDLNESDLSRNEYVQMILHYKAVCRSYKKQLQDSHRTIRELHFQIEQLESKNSSQKKHKMELMKIESDENMKITIEKCGLYCEKINEYIESKSEDEDSGHPNEDKFNETKDEMIIRTLQNIIKEKREIKNFVKPFTSLLKYINPNLNELKITNTTSFSNLNKLLKETIEYLNENSLEKFHCRCNSFYDFEKQSGRNEELFLTYGINNNNNTMGINNSNSKILNHRRADLKHSSVSSSSSLASSCSSSSSSQTKPVQINQNKNDYFRHKPSEEYLVNSLNLFQNLFDVDCYINVPTKMNELYYKYGQLINFKKAIQNIFDPNETYSIEKLVGSVQSMHKQLNTHVISNLKKLLHSNKLEKVVDKFQMYDEYFPMFYKLLEQIMNALEISRLDQIMPSIRALKILATPTLS